MSTALVTDSTAYLPRRPPRQTLDVHVVPLHVVVGGKEYSEGVDIDAGAVAAALRTFTPSRRPARRRPLLQAYRAAAEGGADAGGVGAHLGEMSSTIAGAGLRRGRSPGAGDRRRLAVHGDGDGVRRSRRRAAGRRRRVGRGRRGCRARRARRRPSCSTSTPSSTSGGAAASARRGPARLGVVDQAHSSGCATGTSSPRAGAHLQPGHRPPRGPRGGGGPRPAERLRGLDVVVHHLDSTERGGAARGAAPGPAGRGWRSGSSSWGAVVRGPCRAGHARRRRGAEAGALTDGPAPRRGRPRGRRVLPRRVGEPGIPGRPALGRDLRTSGSGNPGATNAGRVLGRKWGLLVLVLDVAKAYVPTLLVQAHPGHGAGARRGVRGGAGTRVQPVPGWSRRQGCSVCPRCGARRGAPGRPRCGRRVRAGEDGPAVRRRGVGCDRGRHRAVGVLGVVGLAPFVGPVVGAWLVLLALVVLSRHRRNIVAWWARRVR